ncbi:segregation/condensation protein A [Streptomyces canus]|uniref:segregation/condensation protein A n=1 Tax=Streptomyces canus TaxID=58343 RepID=UPI000746390C|nr:segregation/condensation protein A [Streptomyces canus]KUN00533.1 chromosome segregation protein ScpA [Streptomyces canus]
MTSNDAPVPGGSAGRRRALGRGPGAEPVASPVEGDSAPAEAKSAPLEADSEPVEAESGPVEADSGPLVAKSAPLEAGSEPVEAESGPVEADSGPVEADSGPLVAKSAPLEADSEPVEAESGPVEADSGPLVAKSAPLEAGSEPVQADSEPLEADSAPVAEVEAPAGTGEREEASDGVFKVRLANFEGPFDLLLQLISKHKLDVTEVALSKVTDEFMAYIRAMGPDWDLDETTEFLVVAATLLDLKAARLLPAAQVEDEADLALLEARDLLFARLLQYRAYKQIADIFNRRLDEEAQRYPRTVGLEPHHAELLPEVVISIGAEGFAKLAVKAMQPKPKPQVYVDHIHAPLVSVQEQAGIVVARLRELGEASFRLLVEDADGTLTVVARFLALLELYREKAVALDQETALGELMVRWTGGAGEAEPVVTDEFDRPPEPPKEDKA